MSSALESDSVLGQHLYKVNDNILLRPLVLSDAVSSFELVNKNRDHLRKWLPWVDLIKNVEDEIEYVKSSMDSIRDGSKLELGIFERIIFPGSENWCMIGACGYVKTENNCATLGYWIDKNHTGKGIVTNSCKCLMRHTVKKLGLTNVTATVAPKNIGSIEVVKKLGFITDGVISRIDLFGKEEDVLLYVFPKEQLVNLNSS